MNGPVVAPPQNQRSGGHYIEPAQDRKAIAASRAFAQLDREVQEASTYPFPFPANSTNPSLSEQYTYALLNSFDDCWLTLIFQDSTLREKGTHIESANDASSLNSIAALRLLNLNLLLSPIVTPRMTLHTFQHPAMAILALTTPAFRSNAMLSMVATWTLVNLLAFFDQRKHEHQTLHIDSITTFHSHCNH